MLTREKWQCASWWIVEQILRALGFVVNYAAAPIIAWFILPHDQQFRARFAMIVVVSIVGGTLTDMLQKLRTIETEMAQVKQALDELKRRIRP